MEGKVKIRGVEWEFYEAMHYFACRTYDPVNIGPRGRLGLKGYHGRFDTLGEAIEVAVGVSARTNPYENEVFDD